MFFHDLLFFHLKQIPLSSQFAYLSFSLWNYVKPLLIPVLKKCPCVSVSLYSVCLPSGGWECCNWSEHSHVFSPECVGTIALVGGGAGDRGIRIRARCELVSSSAQWRTPPYRGRFGSQLAGAEVLRVRSELVLFPLSVPSPPRPASAPLPQRVTVLKQEAPERVLRMGQGGSSTSQSSRPLPICNTCGHQ